MFGEQVETTDPDEREQLSEPQDQISLSSFDSVDPEENKETMSISI